MSQPLDHIASDERPPGSADVVVVGGGIVGAAAAYFLARRGISVALVEKGRVGAEQSSRNWGYCRQQGRAVAELPLIRESMSLWESLPQEIGVDIGFRRTGLIYATDSQRDIADWETWLEAAHQHQIQSRLLSAREVEAMTPGSRAKWIGALFTPTDGRAEPARVAPALAAAARRSGACVMQSCAVRGVETQGGAVSGVVTEAGRIRTSTVLLAGGAWSSLFLRRHGIDFPQLTVRSSVLRTTPGPEVIAGGLNNPKFSICRRLDGGYTVTMRGRQYADIVPDSFRYFRAFLPALATEAREIRLRFGRPFFEALFQSHDWDLDRPTIFEARRILSPAPDMATLDKALRNLKAAYPILADLGIASSWAGMIDTTPDAVPVIGPLTRMPGLFLAAGFSGHGFGLGPGAGRLAADLVSGAAPVVDPHPFRYERLFQA